MWFHRTPTVHPLCCFSATTLSTPNPPTTGRPIIGACPSTGSFLSGEIRETAGELRRLHQVLGHQHARRSARVRPAHSHNRHLPEKMRVKSSRPTQQVMKTNILKRTSPLCSNCPGVQLLAWHWTSASPVISEQDANRIAVEAYIHFFPPVTKDVTRKGEHQH